MSSVTSADGTKISYRQFGHGPGIVLVHGSVRSSEDYTRLATFLADTFTVYAVDRRGRGESGPQGPEYGFQKEREDIAAVLQATGATLLFGHSFGGAVGLEVALASFLTRLALYEPALSIDGTVSDEFVAELASALQDGNFGEALLASFKIFGDGSRGPPTLVRAILAVPFLSRAVFASSAGRRLRSLLEAALKEARLAQEAGAAYQTYRAVTVETLVVQGETSPAWLRLAADRLVATLPHTKTMMVAGAGHSAPCDEDMPQKVAETLKAFFRSDHPDALDGAVVQVLGR